jgi:hypothetical protein
MHFLTKLGGLTATAIGLAACGGGGDGSASDATSVTALGSNTPNSSLSLEGVAVVGAPLRDFHVTVLGANGQSFEAGPFDNAGGVWRHTFTGKALPTFPLVLQARGHAGGQTVTLHSYMDQAEGALAYANITPYTDVIVRALAPNIDSVVTQKAPLPAALSLPQIRVLKQNLQAALDNVLPSFGLQAQTLDFFKHPLVPDGRGMDGLIEHTKLTLRQDGKVAIANLLGASVEVPTMATRQVPKISLPADGSLPGNIFSVLKQLEQGLLAKDRQQVEGFFEAAAFLDRGNHYTVFKRRNPQWFDGRLQNTSITLLGCEDQARVPATTDFRVEGRVCDVNIGYKQSGKWAVWLTKVAFHKPNGAQEHRVKIVGNRAPSTHVTGVNKLDIQTDADQASLNKVDYVRAGFTFTGAEGIESWHVPFNANGTHGIRGRGNATWTLAKKPYRIKFTQVTDAATGQRNPGLEPRSVAGRPPSRDWILLAQYREEHLMVTPAAQMAARIMHIKHVNSSIPVEVTWNNNRRGVYLLTEAIEAGPGRVDIDISKRPDEGGDYLIELDTYFDEPNQQFRSTIYKDGGGWEGLPVMIKEAKSSTHAKTLAAVQAQFLNLETALQKSTNHADHSDLLRLLDVDSTGKYIAHTMLIANFEFVQTWTPKSVYMYSKKGKFHFGPVWDFDWSGRDNQLIHPVLPFFKELLAQPDVKASFCGAMNAFIKDWDTFEDFIDNYADSIQHAFLRNKLIWPMNHSSSVYAQIGQLKNSYRNRANAYLRTYCM